MFNRRSAVTQLLDDATDTVGSVVSAIPVDDGLDAVGELVADVGDLAIDVAEATGRVGLRLIGRTVRFVGRHPREVVLALVGLAVIGAVVTYLSSSDDTPAA